MTEQSRILSGRVARRGAHSVVIHPRRLIVTSALAVLVPLLGVYGMTIGTLPISFGEVTSVLLGSGPDGPITHVVQNVRLPRVIAAICAGAALGAAGAVIQSVSRNALGSPEIIGFTTGAATGALVQIIVFDAPPIQVALAAVIGGVLTSVLVYLLSKMGGVTGGYRLILTGIGIGATLNAVNELLLVKGDLELSIEANLWLAGSLNARTWFHALPILIGVAVLIPLLALLGRRLTMIEMGDDLSTQLGVPVERIRLAATFIAVLLSGLATAAVGPIAFIALVAPQVVLRLTRSDGVPILGGAAMGALLLLGSDVITQRLPVDYLIPIGRMTGIVGGIYLLWLLTRGAGTTR